MRDRSPRPVRRLRTRDLGLLPEVRWFTEKMAPADYYRAWRNRSDGDRAAGRSPELADPCPLTPVNGHQAIAWLEECVEGPANDQQVLAEQYFSYVEYVAEAGRLRTPEEGRDELEIGYGMAYWLCGLSPVSPESWNIIDYYVANYAGQFYRWAGWRPLPPAHHGVALGLIHDILGHPLQSLRFDPAWRTSTAVALADVMYRSRAFSAMPILADALQDAGCDNDDVLNHCRDEKQAHVRGCWVVDRVLGLE